MIVGKPPFRTATDYLTFQRILRRDMEYPEGMDEGARELIDRCLVSFFGDAQSAISLSALLAWT